MQEILHKELQLNDGSQGHSFRTIFKDAFDTSVSQITIEDPHIKDPYQIKNLEDFLASGPWTQI